MSRIFNPFAQPQVTVISHKTRVNGKMLQVVVAHAAEDRPAPGEIRRLIEDEVKLVAAQRFGTGVLIKRGEDDYWWDVTEAN